MKSGGWQPKGVAKSPLWGATADGSNLRFEAPRLVKQFNRMLREPNTAGFVPEQFKQVTIEFLKPFAQEEVGKPSDFPT